MYLLGLLPLIIQILANLFIVRLASPWTIRMFVIFAPILFSALVVIWPYILIHTLHFETGIQLSIFTLGWVAGIFSFFMQMYFNRRMFRR